MYTLYHYPYSQHARRVVSLMEEAGLEYRLETVAMDQGEYLTAEYATINPNHQVPTLIDGSVKIHESNAILRYLCVKQKLHTWYPSDLPERARVEQWLDWNQCRFSPSVVDIVVNKVFMGDQADVAAIERGEKNLVELFTILDAGLEDRDYLCSLKPTIADLSVASNIFQLGLAKISPPGNNVQQWMRRIGALKGYQKSLPNMD